MWVLTAQRGQDSGGPVREPNLAHLSWDTGAKLSVTLHTQVLTFPQRHALSNTTSYLPSCALDTHFVWESHSQMHRGLAAVVQMTTPFSSSLFGEERT